MVTNLRSEYLKLEKKIGSLKFAVFIILLFAIAMTIGTFVESYYGTEFANRVVYKTLFFMGIQFFMFLSIVFAVYRRMPFKKRLTGFYIIHLGLVLIGAGSFITYYSGIDGSINLPPMTPSRQIYLSNDIIRIEFPDDGKVLTYNLPSTAFKKNIDLAYEKIKLGDYLPYAENEFSWIAEDKKYLANEPRHSSRYIISNPNVAQSFLMSIHPEAIDFKSNLSLGPLTIHYLPHGLAQCFAKNTKSALIIWDTEDSKCFTPEERNIKIKKTSSQNQFLVVEKNGQYYGFFPDISPWPMDDKGQVNKNGSLRIFSRKLFEKEPNLFLFGDNLSYFDKDNSQWLLKKFDHTKKVELPWMGFTIELTEHKTVEVPTYIPTYTLPIQKNNKMIKGGIRALEIEVLEKKYWLTDSKPLSLMINGKRANFFLTKETLTLPFEFVLTEFKMEKDPGTNRPASYESFVKLFTSNGPQKHHIYMNNPLKYQGFTFYQASYSQDSNGNYSSTLSANVDPGRFIKYLGSLLLVLGSMIHYYLNYSKSAKSKNRTNQ